ncbi:hypothetical protein BT63DRAFT_437674 [Microthyrium microscopicum]|uniref:Uncharacterized protein n=1 Tax=Microthyrium microscopicum TaxID=703497 RepID=A0A6A6UJR1_9PEZI|nr:hypothetical protein BT63DRAFT_437674 [Microthyrium microscopicum]
MCSIFCKLNCGSYDLSCAARSFKTHDPRRQSTIQHEFDSRMATHSHRRAALLQTFHTQFQKGSIIVGALGAYTTISLLLSSSTLTDDTEYAKQPHVFTASATRSFVAAAWLLFMLSLATAAAALVTLEYSYATARPEVDSGDGGSYMEKPKKGDREGGWSHEMGAAVASGVVFILLLGAFLLCSLAVTAYNTAVGVVGVVMVSLFILLSLGAWVRQLIMHKRSRRSSNVMLPSARASRLGADLEEGLWNMVTAGGTQTVHQTQQPGNQIPSASGTMGSNRPGTQRRHQPIIVKDFTISTSSESIA